MEADDDDEPVAPVQDETSTAPEESGPSSLKHAFLEIERLKEELSLAEFNCRRSAEEGLQLLEHNSDLQGRLERAQRLLNTLRSEKEKLQKARSSSSILPLNCNS